MPITRGVALPLSHIDVRVSRSSGPGGQHANVTASRVEAVLDIAATDALSAEQKRRVMARVGPRLVAIAQDTRSQSRNRELALERLRARLASALQVQRPRKATRPSRSAKERRLDAKRRTGERKRGRRRVDDW
jgi:ribosome-associated protein